MTITPRVTIVIPFYNDPYILHAVESALSQSYGNKEIIVVDDGSTQYAELLRPYFPYIHYLGKQNGGTASALNHGIRSASGDYIAWLSSDDVFYPGKLTRQIQYMEENHSDISHTNFNVMNEASHITQQWAGASFTTVKQFYSSFLLGNCVNGCTVMMKRDLLNRMGLFDEGLPYTHDLDLWCRTILSGHNFHYLNEPLTVYRWHSGMGTLKHQAAIEAEVKATLMRYEHALRHLVGTLQG